MVRIIRGEFHHAKAPPQQTENLRGDAPVPGPDCCGCGPIMTMHKTYRDFKKEEKRKHKAKKRARFFLQSARFDIILLWFKFV